LRSFLEGVCLTRHIATYTMVTQFQPSLPHRSGGQHNTFSLAAEGMTPSALSIDAKRIDFQEIQGRRALC
jgi:hypothetical protein